MKKYLLALLLSVFALNVNAAIITYVHTGFGSGGIGDTTFGDAAPLAFSITATGNTDNVDTCGASCFFIDNITASINIDTLGTFKFITPTRFFSTSGGVVGFSRAGASDSDLFDGPTISTPWDMLSSIGPIAGTGELLQWTVPQVLTDGGVLFFNDGTSASTFTATVGAVPEPETYAMMLVGLGLMGFVARRRKENQA